MSADKVGDVTKVVISETFGGFGLSPAAETRLLELGYEPPDGRREGYCGDVERDDPRLVRVVEELGTELASGVYAHLVVVEIPDDAEWYVHEYDGYETIYEQHRSWGSDGESGSQ